METQGQVINIGQVAAIWISPTRPDNVQLVWYDTVNRVHRVYDPHTGDWKPLNPQIITDVNRSTLVDEVATLGGLPLGQFYNLLDSGTLAIAITTTKIFYSDTNGNYIVDDLQAHKQYYINSDNLYIDGTSGVWDTNSGQLRFSFTEQNDASQLDKENDYISIRHNDNGVWSWIKTKIKSFVSSVAGNSIKWNNGFYFNFLSAIDSVKDVSGGIVSKGTYDAKMNDLDNKTQNQIPQQITSALDTAKGYTDNKVTDEEIYNKELPTALTVPSIPPSTPSVGAKLITIFGQIYGWIAKLKHGNSVMLDQGLNPDGVDGNINATDSVVSAFNKVIGWIKKLQLANNINIGTGFEPEGVQGDFSGSDSVQDSIEKLIWRTKHVIKIDEENWHNASSYLDWIIRHDVLFLRFKSRYHSRLIYGTNGNICFKITELSLGDDILQYVNTIFSKIPWLSSVQSGDRIIRQKWIFTGLAEPAFADVKLGGYEPDVVGSTISTCLLFYLCIEEEIDAYTEEVLSTWCGLGSRIYPQLIYIDTNLITSQPPVLQYFNGNYAARPESRFEWSSTPNTILSIPLSF